MLRYLGLLAAWFGTLSSPAFAWDATGHRVIALIAYDRLTPAARARADELIRAHPDYVREFLRRAPEDPAARARAAFLAASVWADTIRNDSRFWDETRDGATPTSLLPGFPNMQRHTHWHYFNKPYTPDGAHAQKQPPPSALSELPRLIRELHTAPAELAAYDLVWIEHIEGDVHQPLHSINRVLKPDTMGDGGGNHVYVNPGRTLHALWDTSPGTDMSDTYVTHYAGEVTAAYPAPRRTEKNPKKWIDESYKIAVREVYTFGNQTGSREQPIRLSEAYVENSKRVAREQIAKAGYRLAAILNESLN
jgi:S1/P1 Nuclease